MPRPVLLAATIFLATSMFPLDAQSPKWTPDDILLAERADQFDLSPDGSLAVWVKLQMDKEKDGMTGNLMLTGLKTTSEVTLTRGTDSHSSPLFSPDGKLIAFLSNRKKPGADDKDGPKQQVWLINPLGGEPYPLTNLEKGVDRFAWLDAETLLLAAAEDASWFEQKTKARKDTTNVVEDESHAPPVRLFRFSLKAKNAVRVTSNTDRISSFKVSPDGKWVVTSHDRSLRYIYDQQIKPVTMLTDVATGKSEQLFTDGKLRAQQVEWMPDSTGFYFSAPYTTHPKFENAAINLLYAFDLARRSPAPVDLSWERGLSYGFAAASDGFVALLADGARPKLARYRKEGSAYKRTLLSSEHAGNIFTLKLAAGSSALVYQHSTASKPAQWYYAALETAAIGSPRQITTLNDGFAKKTIARTEVVRWKGARDEEIEGILYYPHHYEPGKKYPLVAMIHGGPYAADFDAWSETWAYPHQTVAQRGAFILKPNYHGSSQYGLEFGESISGGNYNELEWLDVNKGVDSLIARGLVDPEKLGVMGWSNGSIITIELTTRTPRFKVASAGAGDVNWISDWGNCVFGHAFDSYYIGKTPYEDPQLYIQKSPLFRMDKVVTPTIIFFGTEDKQVPTEQGWQHYRALQYFQKADTRFLLFPGEAHGPRKLVHQQRKVYEELDWLDKYLFKTLTDREEALKPESPLAAAARRQKLGDRPEVVQRGLLEIGRFEVTRAQFAAFDSSYRFAPGTGHFPANGISFEKAKAYAAWLGDGFRLGTEEEMRGFYAASATGNTLDFQAGYPVNPDDAAKLASRIDALGPDALLRPVGSFPGAGEDPAFDLDGNVAEWVTAKNGSGIALGGSADQPADPKRQSTPRPEFIGFRVVRGK